MGHGKPAPHQQKPRCHRSAVGVHNTVLQPREEETPEAHGAAGEARDHRIDEDEAQQLAALGVVEFREPQPNAMFDAWVRRITTFVRPGPEVCSSMMRCGCCGEKRGNRWFWTQLLPFQASLDEDMSFSLRWSDVLSPLTPVCADHVLKPLIMEGEDDGDD